MIVCCGIHITMFGMNDPAQTLMQLEGYIRDGRLEMSEVMATQFTDIVSEQQKTLCTRTNYVRLEGYRYCAMC